MIFYGLIVFTILLWAFQLIRPLPPGRGDYDFGPGITFLIRIVVAIITTLFFWLLYAISRIWQ